MAPVSRNNSQAHDQLILSNKLTRGLAPKQNLTNAVSGNSQVTVKNFTDRENSRLNRENNKTGGVLSNEDISPIKDVD